MTNEVLILGMLLLLPASKIQAEDNDPRLTREEIHSLVDGFKERLEAGHRKALALKDYCARPEANPCREILRAEASDYPQKRQEKPKFLNLEDALRSTTAPISGKGCSGPSMSFWGRFFESYLEEGFVDVLPHPRGCLFSYIVEAFREGDIEPAEGTYRLSVVVFWVEGYLVATRRVQEDLNSFFVPIDRMIKKRKRKSTPVERMVELEFIRDELAGIDADLNLALVETKKRFCAYGYLPWCSGKN